MFDTEQRRIQFVANCTSGDAYDHIWQKLADHEFTNAEEVIQALTDIFGDKNKKIKAKQALAKLYQGNWDFHRYHTEFVKIIRALKLDDDDLKEELTSKLNEKYAMTVLSDDELTYAELVKKLYAVDRRLLASRNANKSPSASNSGNKPQASSAQGEANQTTPNLNAKAPIRTREEFDALYAAGLCKKCCKPIHSKPGEKCGEKWATMPANVKATVAPKQVNSIDQASAVEPELTKN